MRFGLQENPQVQIPRKVGDSGELLAHVLQSQQEISSQPPLSQVEELLRCRQAANLPYKTDRQDKGCSVIPGVWVPDKHTALLNHCGVEGMGTVPARGRVRGSGSHRRAARELPRQTPTSTSAAEDQSLCAHRGLPALAVAAAPS